MAQQKKKSPTPADKTQAPRKKDVRARARKTRMSKGVKILLVAIGCAAMILSVSTMACSGIINQIGAKQLSILACHILSPVLLTYVLSQNGQRDSLAK